jgi:2,3-bisphosphoglycerate-dependent phosphoglycerate mutase
MQRIHLIRHASPAIEPDVPTQLWRLSDRGAEEAAHLAAIAREWRLAAIYTSVERKAESTALILGDALGLQVHVTEGFDELRIDHWIGNADEFSTEVKAIFDHPGLSVHGSERAEAAAARFGAGIDIVRQGPLPAAVVSHGRVLTAYLANVVGLDDPFSVWRSIPMPGWCCIDVESMPPKLASGFEGLPDA